MSSDEKKPRKKRTKFKTKNWTEGQRRRAKDIFISALESGCTLKEANEATGVPGATIWSWRRADPEFALDVRYAEAVGAEKLVQAVEARALKGDTRPVFNNGEQVWHVNPETGERKHYWETQFDTRLQLAVLAARDPARWCPNVRAKIIERELAAAAGEASDVIPTEQVAKLVAMMQQFALDKAATRGDDEDPPDDDE